MDDLDRMIQSLPAREQELIAKRVVELTAAANLRELRALAGKTQEEVAAHTGFRQNNVSRLENRDDMKVSTLNDYVESLGGTLKIVAELGGRRVDLSAIAKRSSKTQSSKTQVKPV